MPQLLTFNFGVELEIVTGYKYEEHMDWHSCAASLSRRLQEQSIPNHVNRDHNKLIEKYQDWSLIQEVTIDNRMMQNRWGMELVSPVFYFEDTGAWQRNLQVVWAVLMDSFQTETNRQCSTHVHISPSSDPWQLAHLKNIARCALFFERTVDAIMPGDRRINLWCQSNRYNIRLRSLPIEQALNTVSSARTIEELVFIMCSYSKESELGRSKKAKKDFVHTPFRWNFTPLCEGSKGTIEFRQPPGSISAEDTATYIEFTIAFVQGAVAMGQAIDLSRPPSLERLRRLVIEGARLSGIRNTRRIENIFRPAVDLPFGMYDLKDVTPLDREKFLKKASEKSITVEKFKKLYGYK